MAMTASFDQTSTWKQCCNQILGFEEAKDEQEDHQATTATSPPFLNLIPPTLFDPSSNTPLDAWMATTNQLVENIHEMKSFLHTKQSTYALSMLDAEASLVQTTLTSFTAQTAVELERLHSTAHSAHRVGIIQILMAVLKEEIADPFAQLVQKRSASLSVALYQNPLQCRLVEQPQQYSDGGVVGALLDDDEKLDLRFRPKQQSTRVLHENFWDTYANPAQQRMRRPVSWVQSLVECGAHEVGSDVEDEFIDEIDDDGSSEPPNKPQDPSRKTSLPAAASSTARRPQPQPHTVDESPQWSIPTDTLHEESMALQQSVMARHHELDSIQQVETAMVTITQLMSQFADLVSEQHSNVFTIHDNVDSAAQAVQAGKDALVDAKEKAYRSHHYMAKGIAGIGFMLLVLHWVLP